MYKHRISGLNSTNKKKPPFPSTIIEFSPEEFMRKRRVNELIEKIGVKNISASGTEKMLGAIVDALWKSNLEQKEKQRAWNLFLGYGFERLRKSIERLQRLKEMRAPPILITREKKLIRKKLKDLEHMLATAVSGKEPLATLALFREARKTGYGCCNYLSKTGRVFAARKRCKIKPIKPDETMKKSLNAFIEATTRKEKNKQLEELLAVLTAKKKIEEGEREFFINELKGLFIEGRSEYPLFQPQFQLRAVNEHLKHFGLILQRSHDSGLIAVPLSGMGSIAEANVFLIDPFYYSKFAPKESSGYFDRATKTIYLSRVPLATALFYLIEEGIEPYIVLHLTLQHEMQHLFDSIIGILKDSRELRELRANLAAVAFSDAPEALPKTFSDAPEALPKRVMENIAKHYPELKDCSTIKEKRRFCLEKLNEQYRTIFGIGYDEIVQAFVRLGSRRQS